MRFALQWGRDVIVAEIVHFQERGKGDSFGLQWGRDVIVAEIRERSRATDQRGNRASMGPRRYRRGNHLTRNHPAFDGD